MDASASDHVFTHAVNVLALIKSAQALVLTIKSYMTTILRLHVVINAIDADCSDSTSETRCVSRAQIVMGMFVNYFFAGFILGKIPFRLSPSFRPMLQRGIDLPSLDVTYFTSLSYYILLLFGLQGVFRIIFRCSRCINAAMR